MSFLGDVGSFALESLPVVGGIASGYGAARREQKSRDFAREQMRFQERMSNTAYQRAVADMRMAGINPMLAYMQGGASAPGGAMAQAEDVIGPAISTAMQGLRLTRELKQMQLTMLQTQALTQKTLAERAVTLDQRDAIRQNIRESESRTRLNNASLPGAKVSGSEGAAWLDMLLRSITTGAGALRPAAIRRR